MEEHEYRLKEMAANSAKLAEESERKDRQLKEAQQMMLQTQREMEERLAAAANSDKTDAEAAAKMQQELEDAKARAADEILQLQQQAEEIKQREAEMQAAREMEEAERIEAQKQKRAMEKTVQAAEDKMRKQKEEVDEAYRKMVRR